MNIHDILSPQCVVQHEPCHSKKEALDILARVIANADPNTSQTEVFDCLFTRERLGSTGLNNGIAIPHGRLKQGKKTLAAFLRLDQGIDYDATDKKPVDLLFGLIVPEDSTDEHLQILAILAEKFSDSDVINKLREAHTAAETYSILTG